MSSLKGLPPNFEWGFATAAYQIEGGVAQDGRGPCIWDIFTHKEPSPCSGGTGDVACDHYNRFEEDLDLLTKFGAKAYRFSLSWSRIIPLGGRDDPINQKGIDFYNKLIDGLIARGITPWLTLYHWDLPQALHDRYKGWLEIENSQEDFERYARVCYQQFGDRVKNWITLNEPWVSAVRVSDAHAANPVTGNATVIEVLTFRNQGFSTGIDAPGRSSTNKDCAEGDSTTEPWIAGKALIMAHARAAKLYNKEFKPKNGGQIGVSLSGDYMEPWDAEDPKDVDAAETRSEFCIGWWANPMLSVSLSSL